jgi:hypothetical protein
METLPNYRPPRERGCNVGVAKFSFPYSILILSYIDIHQARERFCAVSAGCVDDAHICCFATLEPIKCILFELTCGPEQINKMIMELFMEAADNESLKRSRP